MTGKNGHLVKMPAVPYILGLQNVISEGTVLQDDLYTSGYSSGGTMCTHKKIELIARIENYQGHKAINLYSCKECNTTLVMKNRKTPVPLNGEFMSKKVVQDFALAV